MTTIETALSLTVLITVTAAIMAGIATIAAYISAVDIAGAAARASAIGVDYSPPRGTVEIEHNAGLVTATAHVPAAVATMRASAIFPVEY